MALADTANLIVSLNLKGNLARGLGGINAQIDNLARNATVRGGLGQISQGIGVGLRNSAIIGAAGLGVLAVQVRAGVESLRELENVEAQTAAALKSTGAVSGQTAESIRALSEEYETLGGVIDDKVIQAGANVLLTFRRVGKEAFEPALEAALNLSTALDQDLQTSIVQIGKALEDPIRGTQNLRRAGIQFTQAQQDQIKALVEANDLYGAQRLILDELATQVGGRFAAAGTTNAASVARMGDAWEDLQQTLTRATLPAIDKVSRRLTEIFADPAVIASVSEFGDRLAGFLTAENLDRAEEAIRGTFGYLAGLPWGAIGDGLRIAGEGARIAVEQFRSLPPGVQNALITLLAANKLTGGLVATGLAQIASVALGKLKTIMAGNVTVIGKSVIGPGGIGGAASKTGGGVVGGLKAGAALAAIPLVGVAAVEVINFQDMRDKATATLEQKLDNLDRNNLDATQRSIDKIQAQIDMERPFLEGVLFNTNVRPALERELAELTATKLQLQANAREALQADAVLLQHAITAEGRRFTQAREAIGADQALLGTAQRQHELAAIANAKTDVSNALLASLNAKNFQPSVIVKTTNQISNTVIQNSTSQSQTISGTSGFAPY